MKYAFLLIIIFSFTERIMCQELNVITVEPQPQSLTANVQNPIVITFDQPIESTSVNTNTFMVFGRWSGPMDGQISFSGDGSTVIFTPDRSFFYGEWISVRLNNDIQGISTDPLSHGYGFNYWTKTLPASLDLSYDYEITMRLSGEGLIQCYGAYAGDINDDEYSDLTVINENSEDIRVLLNDATGNYSDFILFDMPGSSKPSTNEGSDFNHDGKIDIAIGSTQSNNVSVFLGNNSTIFDNEINYVADDGVRGLAVIDMDGDGWDDIATANRIGDNISLLNNDGTGSFLPPVNIDTGFSQETGIGAADLNNDGYIDLIVGAHESEVIVTLLNDGTGNFTVTDNESTNGRPWMIALGDVNNDGHVDVASANSSSHSISILLGDGNGNLSLSNHYPVGNFPLAIDLGDIDGDGDLDFISSNYGTANFTLWENSGNGIFIDPITYDTEDAGSCAILHDKNNDGAMDITFIDEVADLVIFYSNTPILQVDEFPDSNSIFVYPNPFDHVLYMNQISDSPVLITLFDIQGRILLEKVINNTNEIDLSGIILKEGIYMMRMSCEDFITYETLYKKH
jgi:hypothetical protein